MSSHTKCECSLTHPLQMFDAGNLQVTKFFKRKTEKSGSQVDLPNYHRKKNHLTKRRQYINKRKAEDSIFIKSVLYAKYSLKKKPIVISAAKQCNQKDRDVYAF